MHCDVMMVVERVTVKRRMGKKSKGEGKEVEKDISLSVASTVIQDFNIWLRKNILLNFDLKW